MKTIFRRFSKNFKMNNLRLWSWLVLFVFQLTNFIDPVEPANNSDSDSSSTKEVSLEQEFGVSFKPAGIFGKDAIQVDSSIPAVQTDEDLETWIPPVDYVKNFPFYLSGFDNDNRPIWVVEFGKFNLVKIANSDDKTKDLFEKYLRQISYIALKSTTLKSSSEKPVRQFFIILDYEGSKSSTRNIANPTYLTYCVRLSRMYRQFLEQKVAGVIAINASSVTASFVSLLRPFFSGFLGRLEIYGSDQASWRPQLLERFPKSQLPKWYGGLRAHKPLIVVG